DEMPALQVERGGHGADSSKGPTRSGPVALLELPAAAARARVVAAGLLLDATRRRDRRVVDPPEAQVLHRVAGFVDEALAVCALVAVDRSDVRAKVVAALGEAQRLDLLEDLAERLVVFRRVPARRPAVPCIDEAQRPVRAGDEVRCLVGGDRILGDRRRARL